jgi:hypothetical protein
MDTEQDINSLEKNCHCKRSAAISTFFYEITTPVPSKAKESSALLVMTSHNVTLGQSLKFILRMA